MDRAEAVIRHILNIHNDTPQHHPKHQRGETPMQRPPSLNRLTVYLCGLFVGATVAAGCSSAAEDSGRPSSAAATSAALDPETVVECSNVERAYNAWHWEPTSSADWALVQVKMRIDDGDAFLNAVEGYKDAPALDLAVQIAEYNYQLALVNAGMTISGGSDTSAAEAEIVDVEEAYEVFQQETCK